MNAGSSTRTTCYTPCPIFPDEAQDYYCVTCHTICSAMALLVGPHTSHNCLPLQDAMRFLPSALRREVDDTLQQMTDCYEKPRRVQEERLEQALCFLVEAQTKKQAALRQLHAELAEIEAQLISTAEVKAIACCNWRHQRLQYEFRMKQAWRGVQSLWAALRLGDIDDDTVEEAKSESTSPSPRETATRAYELPPMHMRRSARYELLHIRQRLQKSFREWELQSRSGHQLVDQENESAGSDTFKGTPPRLADMSPCSPKTSGSKRSFAGVPEGHDAAAARACATSDLGTLWEPNPVHLPQPPCVKHLHPFRAQAPSDAETVLLRHIMETEDAHRTDGVPLPSDAFMRQTDGLPRDTNSFAGEVEGSAKGAGPSSPIGFGEPDWCRTRRSEWLRQKERALQAALDSLLSGVGGSESERCVMPSGAQDEGVAEWLTGRPTEAQAGYRSDSAGTHSASSGTEFQRDVLEHVRRRRGLAE